MKHLLGWNGRYGCMMFEINIPAGYTIEEVKKIHEDIGYKCYIFDEKQFTEYEESMKGEEKIMNSKMYQDLEKIIGHYGIDNQLKKFNEETYELIEAILTFGKENNHKSLNHVIEEMGDVYVVLKQLQIYYGISESEIEDIMKFKIERQLQRIVCEEKRRNENNG